MSAVEELIQSDSYYRKKTAWHLLINSKRDKNQALDARLQKHAEALKQDPKMQKWLDSERMQLL